MTTTHVGFRCLSIPFLLLATLAASHAPAATLVPQQTLRRHGLQRSWFTQARLNPARHSIENVVLHKDGLLVLTSTGSVQLYHAETGERLWTTSVGNPNYPSVGPVANDLHVAVVNGSTAYVLDRTDGTILTEAHTTEAAAAAPALSRYFVYVPQFSGRIDAIGIENPRPVPWYFTSAGRIFENPVGSANSIVWASEPGHLYVADPDAGGIRFRYESATPFVAPATVHSETIFAASTGGYVYALKEALGQLKWRYACGGSVIHSPVALGETLFVASQEPALHCIDSKTGRANWITPGISRFVAASPKRVYGIGALGQFVVVDRASGTIESITPSRQQYQAVLNEQNDRLYLFTHDGLLQCLHETGLKQPADHAPKQAAAPAEQAKPEPPKPDEQAVEPEREEPANPFGGNANPFGDSGSPFGGEDANPFGDPSPSNDDSPADSSDSSDDDNPFGGSLDEDDPFGSDNPFG